MKKTFKARQEELWEKESQLKDDTLSLLIEMIKKLTAKQRKLFEGVVINEWDVILSINESHVKIGDGQGGYMQKLADLSLKDLKEIINHIFYLEIIK